MKGRHGLDRCVLVAAAVAAAVVRVWALDIKPAHFDEGVNGWFVDQMARTGFYAYDPTNYHGPLHFYVVFVSQTLLGRNLWALRLPTVVAGVLIVLALWGLRRFLPKGVCLWAACFAAISPALTFYSRYAIHESWQTLFLITATYGVLGMMARGSSKDLWVLLLSAAGLVLTKETYAIHAVVAVIALACLAIYERFVPSFVKREGGQSVRADAFFAKRAWGAHDLLAAGGVSAGLVVFFYSGTFLNWRGLAGLAETHAAWFATGTAGHGHEKPAHYWLELMSRYEWPALLGLMVIPALALPAPRGMRLVGIYSLGVVLAYSIIPYKTPWCILAFLPHLLLCAGFALERIASFGSQARLAALLLGVVVACHSSLATLRVNFRDFTNDAHPYVYVQTYEDVNRLTAPLLQRARLHPETRHLPAEILLDSYYPLPWILGEFTQIAYRKPEARPDFSQADWIVVEKSQATEMAPLVPFDAFVEDFRLRSGQPECRVYFRKESFRDIFPGRAPEHLRAAQERKGHQGTKAAGARPHIHKLP